jgi:Lar family restriction alleviation protein
MSDELKPCPFCGCAGVSISLGFPHFKIKCEDCPGRMEFFSSTRAQAIEAWNGRRPAAEGAPCKLCQSTGLDVPCAYPTEINRQQAQRIAEMEALLATGDSQEATAWMNPKQKAVMDAFIWTQDGQHPEYSVPVFANRLEGAVSFQNRVQPWMAACFGAEISADAYERNHRFLEEAIELVQACGATASEAYQLVDYVYGRPVGEKVQEVGGVMVTLAALCLAQGLDMHAAGETELARIWTKVEAIRAKQAAKPKHSPLPMHIEPASALGKAAATLSDEWVDALIEPVLRAAGSSLKHYTMQKSRDDMRAAMRGALAQSGTSKAEPKL